MKSATSILLLSTVSLLMSFSALAELSENFHHKDWYLVCDNTGTCRAAGYAVMTEEYEPGAVFFKRKAGGESLVTGYFISELSLQNNLHLTINGKDYGLLDDKGRLTQRQITGLINVARQDARIIIHDDHNRWQISDQGMSAVLRKMDEFQHRLHTSSALIVKGNHSLDQVLLPQPEPKIVKAPVIDQALHWIGKDDQRYQSLIDATNSLLETHCDISPDEEERLGYAELNETDAIVTRSCWMAAYNAADLAMIVHKKPPYQPVAINSEVNGYSNGTLYMSMKGRGLGDCWNVREWVYDGKTFRLSSDFDTGLCRGFGGGIDPMPSFVSDVVGKNGKPASD